MQISNNIHANSTNNSANINTKTENIRTKTLDNASNESVFKKIKHDKLSDIMKEKMNAELVAEVYADFEDRRNERRSFELAWELNINYKLGNQFLAVSPRGEIDEIPKNYLWEQREVFNHIAPIIETRLSKLGRVKPSFAVRPRGSESKDIYSAKLSKAILESFASKVDLSSLISKATLWSEVCGTSFYKILWNTNKGEVIYSNDENAILAGDVQLSVCSPFEIFPSSSGATSIEDCESIIHARPYPASKVREIYSVDVEGTDNDTLSFNSFGMSSMTGGDESVSRNCHSIKHDHVLIIEKYIKPSIEFPNGRLIIVGGGKLLSNTELPFITSEGDERGFPFVRQISTEAIGSFWGTSVIDRCIPIQRAYNAVKNRKHEFMARLASGVLAVEEGSVDLDNLEDDGLAPGKVLVYRAGSPIPRFMDAGDVPNDFNSEEDRLLNEFIAVSGVSELMRGSAVPSGVSSGTALNLLIEQDDTRLSSCAEHIRESIMEIGKKTLRLYKQFADNKRLSQKVDGNGDVEIFYWRGSDISSDDVIMDTTNELSETPATRKSLLLELLKNGLLTDENGKMSGRMRARVLEALGFGIWENTLDIVALNIKNANKENIMCGEIKPPLEIDDHDVHIEEHTKFILSGDADDFGHGRSLMVQEHISLHKKMKAEMQNVLINTDANHELKHFYRAEYEWYRSCSLPCTPASRSAGAHLDEPASAPSHY
ncbi:MAG: hypothetical protein RR334_03750 [Clostridia bacterium]